MQNYSQLELIKLSIKKNYDKVLYEEEGVENDYLWEQTTAVLRAKVSTVRLSARLPKNTQVQWQFDVFSYLFGTIDPISLHGL